MAVASKTWSVGEVVTAANMNTYVRDNDADLQANKLNIKTGNYAGTTGDPQAVTGVGFEPTFLKIWKEVTDGNDSISWETTDDLIDNDVDGLAAVISKSGGVLVLRMLDGNIKSLDADGFTVSATANTTGDTYSFYALGVG